MEDEIIKGINHVKKKMFSVTSQKQAQQGQLVEAFKSMKDNSPIFNKPKEGKDFILLLIRTIITDK